MTMNLVSIGVFGRAPLQKLHQRTNVSYQMRPAPATPTPKKNLEFGANSMFFLELLKGCSKNTSFTLTRGVRGYLPTIATNYTTYPFYSIFPSPHPGFSYIFTILPDGTRPISTFKMTPTYLPLLSRGSFIFTIFAYVARHDGLTSWRRVSRSRRNVLNAPGQLLSSSSLTSSLLPL